MPIIVTLLLVFTALKMDGVIAWSWLWVLSPLWITVALISIAALISVIVEGLRE